MYCMRVTSHLPTYSAFMLWTYGSCSSGIYKRHRLLTFKDAFYYFACAKLYEEINEPVLKYFSERLEGFSVNHEYSTRFKTSNGIVPPLFYR